MVCLLKCMVKKIKLEKMQTNVTKLVEEDMLLCSYFSILYL